MNAADADQSKSNPRQRRSSAAHSSSSFSRNSVVESFRLERVFRRRRRRFVVVIIVAEICSAVVSGKQFVRRRVFRLKDERLVLILPEMIEKGAAPRRQLELSDRRQFFKGEVNLFSALGNNELVRNIVLVALHTGMRRGEIFNLKWFDVDFNRGLIQIRESKSGKKRLVPMNETVRQLFADLKRKSEFVFPSPKTGGRLDNIKRNLRRAVEEGLERPQPDLLTNGHAEQRNARQAPGPGPGLALEIASDRPCHEEAARARTIVDGSLHGTKDTWDDLPLIDEDRFHEPPKSGVRVRPERHRFSLAIKSNDGPRQAGGRRRLAGGPRPGEEQGRKLRRESAEQPVDEAWAVVGHVWTIPLCRILQ